VIIMEDKVKSIIVALEELTGDNTVPRNVRTKLENTIKALKEESELSIRINKALNELDEISDDTNIQPYTRTQIWNIVSLLETVLS